jgi:hypothetical protein
MDYGLVSTIARLTNTTPNWDREVSRAFERSASWSSSSTFR